MIVPSLGQEELVEMILEVTDRADRPERRLHARRPIRSSVRVRTASGTWFATSVDVSAGGILLEIESRLHPPLAERLQITLPIPGTADELTLDARPVRLLAPAYGSPVPRMMAAVFLHRDAESVGHLERALAPLRPAAAVAAS